MNMQITDAPLFRGIDESEASSMLPCLGQSERTYARGERVLHAGQSASRIGVLLSGLLHIEVVDAWGQVTVLESVGPGEPFAVAYACAKDGILDVDVVADVESTVAWIDARRAMHSCPKQCSCHAMLVRNLLVSMAGKNVALNRRAMAVAPKTVRGKIMAYLSLRQKTCGTPAFTIPFTQEKLAAYLGVDRSTLSAELSALRKEGLIAYKGKKFELLG